MKEIYIEMIKCLTCGDKFKKGRVCSCPDLRYRQWKPTSSELVKESK